jgi:hypothetical protein
VENLHRRTGSPTASSVSRSESVADWIGALGIGLQGMVVFRTEAEWDCPRPSSATRIHLQGNTARLRCRLEIVVQQKLIIPIKSANDNTAKQSQDRAADEFYNVVLKDGIVDSFYDAFFSVSLCKRKFVNSGSARV